MIFNRDILNNLCLNITDGEHASVQNDEEGKYYLLSNKNIINGQIVITNNERKISYETFAKINKRTKLKKGDLVISTVGILGKLAIIKEENLNYDFQRSVGMIKCDESLLNTNYLYHYLNSDFVQLRLNYLSKGAVQKCLFISDIKNLEIDFPDISHQQKIAKVLSDLDAKIELNNNINAELEAMAKTLYDYWFVQFDFPDANGKPYKSSGGIMVWNEELKREIPEGWEVKNIGEVTDVKAGGDKPKEYSEIKTDTYKIPIFSNGITNDGLYGYTKEAKILKPSLTVSARGTIGYCVLRNKPFVPIIRLIVITPKNSYEVKYFYEFIKNLEFENSGSVQQQLTVPQISNLKIILPSIDLLKKYELLTSAGIDKIEINKKENHELTSLRDWLLPMLMNGQVSVGGYEVEERELGMVSEKGVEYKK